MRLRERKREFLNQEGYLVIRGFFSVEEIAEVCESQEAFYRGDADQVPDFQWPGPRVICAKSRKHPYVSFFSNPINLLVRDGRLGKLIKEVTGMSEVRFWHDQLLYEEPRLAEGGEIDYYWHREESRWKTCKADQMVTAWIPLVDFTAEMGPITIVPGGRDESAAKRMVLNAGDLVVFHDDTLHGNPPNFGNVPRRALAAHFASGDLRYVPCGKFSHVNERVVRKIDGIPDFQDERVCPVVA